MSMKLVLLVGDCDGRCRQASLGEHVVVDHVTCPMVAQKLLQLGQHDFVAIGPAAPHRGDRSQMLLRRFARQLPVTVLPCAEPDYCLEECDTGGRGAVEHLRASLHSPMPVTRAGLPVYHRALRFL